MPRNSKSTGKKRRNPNDPPPPPPGDGNPLTREYWRKRAAEIPILKVRIADLEAALVERVGDDAEGITASRMKKVLNQRPEADSGPLEERIREWLSKDVKGFEAAIEEKEEKASGHAELRAENADLKDELETLRPKRSGPDKGAAKTRELLDGLFTSFGADP